MAAHLIPAEMDDFLVEKRNSLKEMLQNLVATASSIEVTNEEHFRKITGLYAESKDWEKRIEFLRKQANQPDQERINARNDKAKEVIAPLKQVQSIAKQKCDRYQLMLEEAKKLEQKKIQDAVDLLGLDEAPIVAPLDKSVRGDGALMFTRTVRKFRIVDRELIPDKFFEVNIDAIENAISLGVNEIPGIEIYEEKVTQLKTR